MKTKMNETKTKMKKMAALGCMTLVAMLSALTIAGCGCESKGTSTAATIDEVAPNETVVVETLGETDQAVVDAGLSVDANGDVVDKNGNKVKTTEDGKVEVKTADGKTVTVDAKEVKTANENKEKVDAINEAATEEALKAASNSGNAGGSGNNNSGSGNSTQKQNSTTQTSKTQTSKNTQTSTASSSAASAPNQQSQQSSKPQQSSASQQSSKPQPTTVDPHAGKTYYDNEYEYIKHPAETKQVKVVDVPEHEETVEEEERYYTSCICWGCGQDIGPLIDAGDGSDRDHMSEHRANGEPTGYHSGYLTRTVTKTITVPEQSHYETVVTKEAWTEKVLVREAGWY